MGPRGGLLVQPSGDPLGETIEDSLASTLPLGNAPSVEKTAPMLPVVSLPQSPKAAPVPRLVTPPQAADAWLGIAVAPTGDRAVGVGPRGVTRWKGDAWTSVDLPEEVDASRMRAIAWHESVMAFAGAWPIIAAILPGGKWETWRLDRKGLAFHGAFADERGILLSGERVARTGTVGVVVEIAREGDGWLPPRLNYLPGCGPLRGVTRLGRDILACGDGGALALVPAEGAARFVRECEPALNALLALPDGTAVAVGCGGVVFRVRPTLHVERDAIQAPTDLFAVGRAPDGTLYCGGAGGSVFRLGSQSWARHRCGDGGATIRAVHAGPEKVVTFSADGSVWACGAS